MFRHLRMLQQVSRRTLTRSAPRQLENKVPKNQKLFQEDNDLPIHLKGGFVDEILYRTSMTVTFFGSGYALYLAYGLYNK